MCWLTASETHEQKDNDNDNDEDDDYDNSVLLLSVFQQQRNYDRQKLTRIQTNVFLVSVCYTPFAFGK